MQITIPAIAIIAMASTVHAGTITFDTTEQWDGNGWTEGDFYGYVAFWDNPGGGTIHGPGGPMAGSADIIRDKPFAPISIDVGGHGAYNEDLPDGVWSVPYDNLVFRGYYMDRLIAAVAMQTEDRGDFTYHFDETFSGIDTLVISTPYDGGPNGEWCDDCSAIQFDNLVWKDAPPAPVPLPSTALLLFSAVSAFAVMRRMVGRDGLEPPTFSV